MTIDSDSIIGQTRDWLTRAVIGLNLCPFAKSVHVKEQIRYVVSDAATPEQLVEHLVTELSLLRDADPEEIDTTLLIHPLVLQDFDDYNAFLDVVDAVIDEMELEGELQVASFHPQYQFDGTEHDDILAGPGERRRLLDRARIVAEVVPGNQDDGGSHHASDVR